MCFWLFFFFKYPSQFSMIVRRLYNLFWSLTNFLEKVSALRPQFFNDFLCHYYIGLIRPLRSVPLLSTCSTRNSALTNALVDAQVSAVLGSLSPTVLSGGTHRIRGQTRPSTVPTHERCVPQPRHSMALRTRQSDPENTTTGKGGPQHCRHLQDVPSLGDPGAPSQKQGPPVLLLQLGVIPTIRSLLPEVTVLVILPNSTTDLLGSLREEQNMLTAHRPTKGPRALLNYTAIIFASPAPAPAGRCHPDTTGKQHHDPQGDVSAP